MRALSLYVSLILMRPNLQSFVPAMCFVLSACASPLRFGKRFFFFFHDSRPGRRILADVWLPRKEMKIKENLGIFNIFSVVFGFFGE